MRQGAGVLNRWSGASQKRLLVTGMLVGVLFVLTVNWLLPSSQSTDLTINEIQFEQEIERVKVKDSFEDEIKWHREDYRCSPGHMTSKLRWLLQRLEGVTNKTELAALKEFYIPEFAETRKEMRNDSAWMRSTGSAATGNFGGAEDMGIWTYYTDANRTLEVGFAGAGSATEFVAAHLSKKSPGQHIAIDPVERIAWKGHGLRYVQRLIEKWKNATSQSDKTPRQTPKPFKSDPYIQIVDNYFAWYEEESTLALSALARKKEKFDVIFLDGGHLFENNIVEGALAMKLVAKKGIIIMHDMWMPSVQSAVNYLLSNLPCCLVLEQDNVAVLMPAEKKREWTSYWNFDCHTEKKE